MNYFEELQHDWHRLGFGQDTNLSNRFKPTKDIAPIDVENYDDLHHLMINATLNVASVHDEWSRNQLGGASRENMQTEFGRRLLDLCMEPSFVRSVDRWMCPDSEPNIAISFEPRNIRSKDCPSPVIVTREEVAIGAIKRIGERSYYALRDDPQTNTHAGNVYRTPLTNWFRPFKHIAKSASAARIEVNKVDSFIKMSRFTFFAIPTEARVDIRVPQYKQTLRHSLNTSHEELVTAIDEALPDAVPTKLGRRYEPKGGK